MTNDTQWSPEWTVGPITRMQNWRLYTCFVHRLIADGEGKPNYQSFQAIGSTEEKCTAVAADIILGLK